MCWGGGAVLRAALSGDLPWIFLCKTLPVIADSRRVCASWGRFFRYYHSTLPKAFPGASAGFWVLVRAAFSASAMFSLGQVGGAHPEAASSPAHLLSGAGHGQPGESAGGTVALACRAVG